MKWEDHLIIPACVPKAAEAKGLTHAEAQWGLWNQWEWGRVPVVPIKCFTDRYDLHGVDVQSQGPQTQSRRKQMGHARVRESRTPHNHLQAGVGEPDRV